MFLGVLIAAYQPLIGNSSERLLARFRRATLWTLAVFGWSLVCVVLDASWLIAGGGDRFYAISVALFFLQLAALAGIAVYATVGVLLRG